MVREGGPSVLLFFKARFPACAGMTETIEHRKIKTPLPKPESRKNGILTLVRAFARTAVPPYFIRPHNPVEPYYEFSRTFPPEGFIRLERSRKDCSLTMSQLSSLGSTVVSGVIAIELNITLPPIKANYEGSTPSLISNPHNFETGSLDSRFCRNDIIFG